MPTDQAGNYTLPPTYLALAGTTILAGQHNAPLEDLAQAMSQRLMRDGRNGMVGPLNLGSFKGINAAPGTLPTDLATVGQGVPIGAVMDFAGTMAPAGWILCFGQAVSRSEYPALFSAIGTTYGNGNGSTTFNLPDLRGRVISGKDDMGGADAGRLVDFGPVARTLGGILGAGWVYLTTGQMPIHTHTVNDPGHSHSYTQAAELPIPRGAGGVNTPALQTITAQTSHVGTGITVQNAGSSEAHPNAQPTMIMNKVIKATY